MATDLSDSKNKIEPVHDLIKMMEEVGEKYSMLQYADSSSLGWNKNEFVKPAVNYINVIDLCNK